MSPRARARVGVAPAAGFTLIELLAVLLILSLLVWVLLAQLRDSQKAVQVQQAQQLLAKIGAAVDDYANEQGGYPPSSFVAGQEVANDGLNVGIEALVVALWSKKHDAGGLLDDVRDQLVNTDGDKSTKALTDFDNRDLLEIPDPWGNPVAYVERSDYPVTNRRYLTYDAESGEAIESVPVAFKNPTTGQYYAHNGFQLISAGPDGRFGTEDDVTSFERD